MSNIVGICEECGCPVDADDHHIHDEQSGNDFCDFDCFTNWVVKTLPPQTTNAQIHMEGF